MSQYLFSRGVNGGPAGLQAGQETEEELPYETKGFDYGKYALVSFLACTILLS